MRRRKDEPPVKEDDTACIAHYKLYYSQFLPPCSPSSLYTSTCDKCCSQGGSYIVDTTSKILGEVDITSMTSGSETFSQCLVRMCVASLYSQGVLVSPGQLDVVRTAARSGAVIVMALAESRHRGPVSDAVLQTLALIRHGVGPPTLTIVRDMSSWDYWALSVLGTETTKDSQSDLSKIISKGGIVMTENTSVTLRTFIDKCKTRNLLIVPTSVSQDLCDRSLRGHRARLDIGRPMSVKEMIRGRDSGLARLVTHCDIIGRRQTRITPSQLVSFAVETDFMNLKRQQELTIKDLSKAVSELIPLLEIRGARMSFSGETEDVIMWAVKRMGGHVSSDKVSLESLERDDEFLSRADSLESYFLFDFAVSVGVFTVLKNRVPTSRTGWRSRRQSLTVGHQEVVDTALNVLQFLAEDRVSLLPCEDLNQGVMEAMFRAEISGSLTTVTEEGRSQYEAEMNERQRYGWRHGDEEDREYDMTEDTRMVVGHSQEGRNWLDWTAGIMRHRLMNLYITLLILYNNVNTEIFTITELETMVKKEVERKRKEGWKGSCRVGVPTTTKKSITALAILGIVNIIHKQEICLVNVVRHQEIAEMIQVVLEFG